MILIIIVQRFRLEMTEICHAPDTYGMIIKVILLKKNRTHWLYEFRLQLVSNFYYKYDQSYCLPSVCV